MGGLLHLVQRGGNLAGPQPAHAVPNVTVHPSTTSVPIAVLLYIGPLLCAFSVPIKGLKWKNRVQYIACIARNKVNEIGLVAQRSYSLANRPMVNCKSINISNRLVCLQLHSTLSWNIICFRTVNAGQDAADRFEHVSNAVCGLRSMLGRHRRIWRHTRFRLIAAAARGWVAATQWRRAIRRQIVEIPRREIGISVRQRRCDRATGLR